MIQSLKSALAVSVFITISLPPVANAECRKHVSLVDEATVAGLALPAPDAPVHKDSITGKPVISLWSVPGGLAKGAKVVGQIAPGTTGIFVDRQDGSVQLQVIDPKGGKELTGWVEKQFARKPTMLETGTLKACAAANKDGRGNREGKEGGKRNKANRDAQG